MFQDKFINIYLNDLNKLMEFPYFCLSIQLFDVKIKKNIQMLNLLKAHKGCNKIQNIQRMHTHKQKVG